MIYTLSLHDTQVGYDIAGTGPLFGHAEVLAAIREIVHELGIQKLRRIVQDEQHVEYRDNRYILKIWKQC